MALCEKCLSESGHCWGAIDSCKCECVYHVIEPDDPRMDLIRILTAEAHNDFQLLIDEINELNDERCKTILLLMTKYAISIAKTYGENPIATVQKAALFFAGGQTEE